MGLSDKELNEQREVKRTVGESFAKVNDHGKTKEPSSCKCLNKVMVAERLL